MLRIIWKEKAGLRPYGGHGVDFLAGSEGSSENVVAVIRGFAWFHGEADTVKISIRPPDEVYDQAFLAEAKQVIAAAVLGGHLTRPAWLSPTIYAHINA